MKKFLALILALVMCLSLAACGGNKTETTEPANTEDDTSDEETVTFEPMTWKVAISATDNTPWANMCLEFGELVSEATGGAVTVDVYSSDQLTAGVQTEGIQGVIDGTIELSAHSNIIYSSFDPRLNVVSLPFLFSSFDDVDAKLDGAAGEAVGAVVEDMGLHLLGIAENGFRHVTNSVRPIEGVADMKGLKIRVAGSTLLNREYDLWGANWSNANWSEVYTGLQTGTYEGQENPLPTADAASISEVQSYVTYWTGVYDCIFFTMNGELYDSLSPELQAIVDEAGKTAVQHQRENERAQDEEILARWEEAGVTVTRLSEEGAAEFKAAAEPCYEEFAEVLTPELIAAFTE